MAKLTLRTGIENTFKLWGVNSVNAPHRLCWLINKDLDWNFIRMDDIKVLKKDKSIYKKATKEEIIPDAALLYQYPLFQFNNESLHFKVDVIHNKGEAESFHPELKQFDYLLLARGSFSLFPEDLKARVQKLDGVQTVLPIEPKRLKDSIRLHLYES